MAEEQTVRKYRGEALREQVLSTALRLFSNRGYFNTSIHDIRKEAGVSIGAIYHHFGTKEALAKSLYDELMEQMEQTIAEAIEGRSSCRDRCHAIVAALFEATVDRPQAMDFVLMARHREFMPDEPPICSSQPFVMMKNAVQQGMDDGDIRQMDGWVAASAVFGGALRLMSLQLDGGLTVPLNDLLDETVECGWRAVAVN